MPLPEGYVKAQLAIEGGETIKALFNPTEYSITKTNNWTFDKVKGKSLPPPKFGGGKPREMAVNLLLDQSLPNDGLSVKDMTDKLFKMMEVPAGGGGGSAKSAPPLVTFQWGEMIPFKAVCTSLTVTFQLFKPNGTPIRADVKLALKQAETADGGEHERREADEPDDALGRRASASTSSTTATRCSRSPSAPTATRTAGGSWPRPTASTTPCTCGAARPSTCPGSTDAAREARRLRHGQGDGAPLDQGHGLRGEDRGPQRGRPARHGHRPAGGPRGHGARPPTRRSRSRTRSRSPSATRRAAARVVFKGEIVAMETEFTAPRRRSRCAPTTARTGSSAAGGAHLPGPDAVRRRPRSSRTGSQPDIETPRPCTTSSSRAWRATSTSSPGSRRARTASSASRRARLPARRRKAAARPSSSGGRTSSRSSRA